ncbi:MAG: ImmA/IrrE family metallo-endopeptidase [Woeseiaceae bacterium]
MAYTNAHIHEIANNLLRQVTQDSFYIDINLIADFLNIETYDEDLEDEMSGFLVVKNKIPSIAINKRHHINRRRFTLAHEIGHFCLHVDENEDESVFMDKKVFHRNKDASKGVIRMEIEANKFAADLLMPRFLIEKAVSEKYEDIDLEDENEIESMASDFGVSTTALAYRLGSLGFISKL